MDGALAISPVKRETVHCGRIPYASRSCTLKLYCVLVGPAIVSETRESRDVPENHRLLFKWELLPESG